MEITIRPAVPADIPAIAANNRAIALETEGWALNPAVALAGAATLVANPARGFYLIAEAGGEVVGQCMVTYEWSDWRNGEFWWVQSVYVRPGCRRRGIFARLYQTVEAMAESRPDVTGLRLYVETGNVAAQQAYLRLGMRPAPYLLLERDYAKEQVRGATGPTKPEREGGGATGGKGGPAPPTTDALGPWADGEGDARPEPGPGHPSMIGDRIN